MKTNSGVIWTSQTGKTRTIQNVPYYDVVIRTQAEFEALYNNATWFDATSVLFVGDGGVLKFTRSDGNGIKIPQSVKQIQGMNNATIEVTNFVYSGSNKGGIFYATLPTQNGTTKTESLPGYGIDSLLVNCTGNNGIGFHSCTQLTNCTGTGTGTGSGSNGYGYGFHSCTQLTNCTGTGNSSSGFSGIGFYSCTQLTNCTGTGNNSSGSDGIGFYSCTQLTNCTGTGNNSSGSNGYGYGFYSCTQLTNCTGTGNSSNYGVGFYSCAWVNGCKQGARASSTSFTGGTMQHVDTATVAAV